MKKTLIIILLISMLFGCSNPEENKPQNTIDISGEKIEKKEDIETTIKASDLVGDYQDKTSQSACAFIKSKDEEILIEVEWVISDGEFQAWSMTGKIEGNKISYVNGIHEVTFAVENGVDASILDDYKEGYFEIIDGNIAWTGSGHSETSSCLFEKIN